MSARLAQRAAKAKCGPEKLPMPKGSGVYRHVARPRNIEVVRLPEKCWLSMPPAIEAIFKEKTDDDKPTDLRGVTPTPESEKRKTKEPPKGQYYGHYVAGPNGEAPKAVDEKTRRDSIVPFCEGSSKPDKSPLEQALLEFNRDMAEEDKILNPQSREARESRSFAPPPPLPAGVSLEFGGKREVKSKKVGADVIPITVAKGYRPKRVREREEIQERPTVRRKNKKPPANPDPMVQQLNEALVV